MRWVKAVLATVALFIVMYVIAHYMVEAAPDREIIAIRGVVLMLAIAHFYREFAPTHEE